MPSPRLRGTSVIVAGAGFAGLTAARALERDGAAVTVIEARNRVGGRVWTIRDGFKDRQHAEAGGDLIDAEQTTLLETARELRLEPVQILRRGFGNYGPDRQGRHAIQSQAAAFKQIAPLVAPYVREYQLAEHRWNGAIAAELARTSVAEWLKQIRAPTSLVERLRALRGLFLADPERLSLLALVDFFADDGAGPGRMFRLRGGNDRLATSIARRLRTPPELGTVLRRVRQDRDAVTLTVESDGQLAELGADFLVSTLPATALREVFFDPPVPEPQRQAIAFLRYGPATRLLVQFEKAFWRSPGRPRAFGSDQPWGAIWDGNEQQRGPAAILSFLAGGDASSALQAILRREGVEGLVPRLGWLGRASPILTVSTTTWERDPWAGGGYAYFDPSFRPEWRDLLARPAGRVIFAGEHTSVRWQGYMNGAIESGLRAAAEIAALIPLRRASGR